MKKIVFLGDSITEGAGASCYEKCYVSLVGEVPGIEVVNYGVGGTRIARQIINHNPQKYIYNYDFNLRTEIMVNEADYVYVFGGTNDFGHGVAPIGDFDKDDYYTFAGALNILCKTLIEKYGLDKICFILPINRHGDTKDYLLSLPFDFSWKPSLKEYKNVMKKILNKYGIRYLCFDEYFPRPLSYEENDLFKDGLHPNDNGHKLLSELIIKDLKENKII